MEVSHLSGSLLEGVAILFCYFSVFAADSARKQGSRIQEQAKSSVGWNVSVRVLARHKGLVSQDLLNESAGPHAETRFVRHDLNGQPYRTASDLLREPAFLSSTAILIILLTPEELLAPIAQMSLKPRLADAD